MSRCFATSSIPPLLCQWIKQIRSGHEILLLGLPWLRKLAHLDSVVHGAVNAGIAKDVCYIQNDAGDCKILKFG
jgi:hypothetical protein